MSVFVHELLVYINNIALNCQSPTSTCPFVTHNHISNDLLQPAGVQIIGTRQRGLQAHWARAREAGHGGGKGERG
jgi:hypothetical protein